MKLGYPCLNNSLPCTSAGTFRLASYSPERVIETTLKNLDCLKQMLLYNVDNDLMFFRIATNIVPFASHPIMDVDWAEACKHEIAEIRDLIARYDMRISMHAHASVWPAALKETTYESTLRELTYNANMLDLFGLDAKAKLQVHMGSFFGDKDQTFARFAGRFSEMPENVRSRLVIENTERYYTLPDCLELSAQTGIPILLDTLHHVIAGTGESFRDAMTAVAATWLPDRDGIPMIDFSSQNVEKRVGAHAETLDPIDFAAFLAETEGIDYDVMFEIKDKEISALKGISVAKDDQRFRGTPDVTAAS